MPNIFDSLSPEDRLKYTAVIRDVLYYSLLLKESPIGRSPAATEIVLNMVQPLFAVFLKLLIETNAEDK